MNNNLFDSDSILLSDSRYGKMFYHKNDAGVGKSIEFYGEWCQLKLDFLKDYIPQAGIVVDIGAHIGYDSLFFADKVGPEGLILAFEPQPFLFQLLHQNKHINNLFQIKPHPFPILEINKHINIPILDTQLNKDFGGVYLLSESERPFYCNAVSLDYIIDLNRVDFLKISANGCESKIIRGAIKTISQHQPILYIENNYFLHEENIVELIYSLDYFVYEHSVDLYNENNFKKNEENIFNSQKKTNLFCLPKSKKIQIDELKQAESKKWANWMKEKERTHRSVYGDLEINKFKGILTF